MKKILLYCLLVFSGLSVFSQASFDLSEKGDPFLSATGNAHSFAATITAADMKSYLEVLASDEMEGRETGTEGQRKAAAFIAAHFERLGLPPIGDDGSYFQKIAYTSEKWDRGQISLHINGCRYRHLSDFYSFPSTNTNLDAFRADEVVFLGYGIDASRYSDYKGVDVKGKTILIYTGEPKKKNGKSQVTGTKKESEWTTNWKKKLETAYQHGVAMVLLIDPDMRDNISKNRSTLLSAEMKMGEGGNPDGRYANNLFISSTLARAIVGNHLDELARLRDAIKRKGRPGHLVLPCQVDIVQKKLKEQLIGSNILGFVEGSDPALKDQIVVVTAHYDHLGKRGNSIYNGADDNGSGTSAVMDIAQAFAEAKKKGEGPRRSVLFMLVSGEEKGLLGSKYYTEHPVFPLENTVANVNVDMIGRMDKNHDNPGYIYVIGADRLSTDLHNINEAANKAYTRLELDYTYNAKNDPNRFYYRSDHYNFAKKGIPAVFFFSGVHEDYHRTTDTVDKIMFDKMVPIAQLIFYTTWELANRDERIRVDVPTVNQD